MLAAWRPFVAQGQLGQRFGGKISIRAGFGTSARLCPQLYWTGPGAVEGLKLPELDILVEAQRLSLALCAEGVRT